jgi:DNA-binding NarL/FixJ family response regulator
MSDIKVFIAHPLFIVREGLRAILQRQNGLECIGDSDQTLDVLRHVQALAPDLVILSADSRPLNGFEIARQLQHTLPTTRVLLLGKQAEGAQLRHAFQAGIAGYVPEQAEGEELLRAIRTAAAGYDAAAPCDTAANGHAGATRRRQPCRLSEREEAVTRLLALGYTGKEIAAQFRLSPKTIETYKSRSLEKLGITSRTGIVKYAVEKGWLNPQPLDATAVEER